MEEFDKQLIANPNQSYLWIQYMAFMHDHLGMDAARRVAEKGVKSISMDNDQEKLNLWTAFANLELNFGTPKTLESVTKRALEINDKLKMTLNLIQVYKTAQKYDKVDELYRQLTKKHG